MGRTGGDVSEVGHGTEKKKRCDGMEHGGWFPTVVGCDTCTLVSL